MATQVPSFGMYVCKGGSQTGMKCLRSMRTRRCTGWFNGPRERIKPTTMHASNCRSCRMGLGRSTIPVLTAGLTVGLTAGGSRSLPIQPWRWRCGLTLRKELGNIHLLSPLRELLDKVEMLGCGTAYITSGCEGQFGDGNLFCSRLAMIGVDPRPFAPLPMRASHHTRLQRIAAEHLSSITAAAPLPAA